MVEQKLIFSHHGFKIANRLLITTAWCVWAGRGSVIEFIFDAVFFSRQKFFGRNERYQKITTKTA